MTQIDWNLLWEQVKSLLGVLAAAGIVIDMTPEIKVQPVRWLLGWVGKRLNRDMQSKLDSLAKDFEAHKVDSWRSEILDFANSCMNRRKHKRKSLTTLFPYTMTTPSMWRKRIENGQVKLAYEYIAELYRHCCEKQFSCGTSKR